MWSQQKRLALLHEELRSIEKIERLHEYSVQPERDDQSREVREERRAEILAEIERLKAEPSWFEGYATDVTVALLLCAATAYVTFHFLMR
jgi:hypothetical protein